MTKKQKDELKIIILETKEKIKNEIVDLEIKCQPIAPDCSLGRLTRSEAMLEQGIYISQLEKAKIRSKKINFVLTKMNSEEFGICSICEEEIPYGRLCLVPESTICVDCANKF